jgi:hypothetical protein
MSIEFFSCKACNESTAHDEHGCCSCRVKVELATKTAYLISCSKLSIEDRLANIEETLYDHKHNHIQKSHTHE